MSRNKILLITLLTVLTTIVGFFVTSRGSISLISPAPKQDKTQPSSFNSSSIPSTPSYNPPKVIKYDSSTDLKQELDSIDPKVLDEDFGT